MAFRLVAVVSILCGAAAYHVTPPPTSPATGLANNIYKWRGQNVRYQVAEPTATSSSSTPVRGAAILVHGLFTNSDHWRKTLPELAAEGYRAYALDLLGCGYSSKPPRESREALSVCGERNGRFLSLQDTQKQQKQSDSAVLESILRGVTLGTAAGGSRMADIALRHPLESCYNFYTWSEQIADFTREVVMPDMAKHQVGTNEDQGISLVCNSIGTISSLQAAIDNSPKTTGVNYNGVFVVSPNFRELHISEVPLPQLTMPVVRTLQSFLRGDGGRNLYNSLAKPDIVKQILLEPYSVKDAVDDALVDALLTPLLSEGASDVVFDTLSYSAGPLPEQQLTQLAASYAPPVWICYGLDDPWTPAKRVERLGTLPELRDLVKRVVPLEGVGHCPHDEAPELVNPLLLEFLEQVNKR